jgi:RpiB/LacA/LacB family sugar-phosphate isomerase
MKERLRAYLRAQGYAVEDCGTFSQRAVDYPDFAHKVAGRVARREAEWGVLVCGTGVGMAMAANKIPGVRAATCNDTLLARFAREHNNANVLALGSRMLDEIAACKILDTWAGTRFAGGRHKQRVEKLTVIEQGPAMEKLS